MIFCYSSVTLRLFEGSGFSCETQRSRNHAYVMAGLARGRSLVINALCRAFGDSLDGRKHVLQQRRLHASLIFSFGLLPCLSKQRAHNDLNIVDILISFGSCLSNWRAHCDLTRSQKTTTNWRPTEPNFKGVIVCIYYGKICMSAEIKHYSLGYIWGSEFRFPFIQ